MKQAKRSKEPHEGGKSVSEKSQDTRTSKNPFEKSSSHHTMIIEGGKSVSEKSQATHTSKNPFEKSSSHHTQYFVCVVKKRRTGK